jgi:glycopeptide antibiotics resistance protein
MITMTVQGKNNIKQQRFKSKQTQYLKTVHSFVYFPTYGVRMLCLCGFKSLLVSQHKKMILPKTINAKFVMKNFGTFLSPLTGT